MSLQPISHVDAARAVDIEGLLPAVESFMVELASDGDDPSGPCARMVIEHLGSGGKRLRARLALDAVAALGGEPRVAVPWAAACELLHNASLVHDDVQDGDRVRRGAPALWTTWGAHQAINAGDLMLMLPTLALERLAAPDGTRWSLASCVARYAARTARGQAWEMALRGDVRMEADAYLHAARGKTAGLFGMPVDGAALLAGRSPDEARALAAPFETLGLLFQLQDDLVDLYGNKGREAPGADIREGKISALAVAHVDLHPEDRLWLARILRTPRDQTGQELVLEVARRFDEGGALDTVLGQVRALAMSVRRTLPDDEPLLVGVAEGLLERICKPLAHLLERGSTC